jgi:hypothetical protein
MTFRARGEAAARLPFCSSSAVDPAPLNLLEARQRPKGSGAKPK